MNSRDGHTGMDASVVGTLIGERYRVEAQLGVGGMGAVYRACDVQSGRTLALKTLRLPSDARDALLVSQFEREFHTLVQLKHPSIIEVYDYGLDERGTAFYTMELLDGQDLRELPPPSWRQACALLRDIASSLAIMHSRRLLHRDISARNIRCTSDGRAKLIDFGAMAPMGLLKSVVGTPPFVPPEALQSQALDGRADLFALGAVFYWLMTRRHAFPARNFGELPDLWRTPIASPRQYAVDLPLALDQLIMQLLTLERSARPASAAEVIERLSGIAGLLADERAQAVSAAYLTTPALVGREALLRDARARLVRARQGNGGTVLIEGGPGSGRSRALDACVLDAKLLGAVVLRADAADGASGDYGVARSLADQLFAALPKLARRCAAPRKAALAHVLPQLVEPQFASLQPSAQALPPVAESVPPLSLEPAQQSLPPGSPAAPQRRQLQSALRDFVLAVAREKLVVLAIDEPEAIDEPSAGLLAALAHAAGRRKLCLLLSAASRSHGNEAALSLLRQLAQPLELPALSAAQSETLLRSVFGDVPNVTAVSECIHRIAAGNPRWTMELAQHLVRRGVARHDAGSWSLPQALSADDVPASLTAGLAAQLAALSQDARELFDALALTDAALIPAHDYPRLTDHADRSRTYRALSDLLAAGLLLGSGDRHRITRVEAASLVRERLPAERARLLHERLAQVLQPAGHPLQLAEHQLLGGHEREGVAAVFALCMDLVRPQLSDQMLQLIEMALTCVERTDKPVRLRMILQFRLFTLAAMRGDYRRFTGLLPVVRESVMRQSGLADYYALDSSLDPERRVQEAMRLARERHLASPERERALAPEEACGWIAYIWGSCAFMAAVAWDIEFVERLPATAPLARFAPTLRNVDWVNAGQIAMQSGRASVAAEHAEAMLREFERPEAAAMPAAAREAARAPFVYTLGIYAAVSGKASALDYIKELEQSTHRSNAWRLRMVYELMHGRTEAAADCQRRAELFALQDSTATTLPGTTTRIELLAGIYADDIIAVKRCSLRIEQLADTYPGWIPVLAMARAHYRRLQGDLEGALIFAEEAVRLAPAGRHLNWGLAAATQLDVLSLLARPEQAYELGLSYLATAEQQVLESPKTTLLRSVAEACLRSGRLEEAGRMADEHLARQLALGTRGLQLGIAHETRARVAIAMRDEAGLQHHAQLCAAEYKDSRNALLSRKYQQLMRDADAAGVTVAALQRHAADFTASARLGEGALTLHSRMLSALDSEERHGHALRLLLDAHGADEGFLFDARGGRLTLLAGSTPREPSADLIRTLEGCLAALSQARVKVDDSDAAATQVYDRNQAAEATAFEAGEDVDARSDAARYDAQVDGFDPLPLFASRGGQRSLVALAALRFDASSSRRVVSNDVLAAFGDALASDDLG